MKSTAASEDPEDSLSKQQQIGILVVDIFSSLLSVIGSSCILWLILRDRQRKLKKTYHRLLLALSLSDINNSARGSIAPFLMPSDTPGVFYAIGTQGTCVAAGFSTQLGLMSPLYSAALAVFYVFSIQPKGKQALRWVEPILHFFAISYPLGAAIVGLFFDLYNPVPNGVGCWVIAYPWDCEDDPEVECVRGENAAFFSIFMGIIPAGLAFLVIVVSMAYMYFSVWWQIKVISTRFNTVKGQNMNRNAVYQLKQTGYQAALYILAYVITNIWPIILRALEEVDHDSKNVTYPLELLTVFFFPLQGFWNFFIYIRPRAADLRRLHPNESFCQILRRVFEREPRPAKRRAKECESSTELHDSAPTGLSTHHAAPTVAATRNDQVPTTDSASNGRLPTTLASADNQEHICDDEDDQDDDGDAFIFRPRTSETMDSEHPVRSRPRRSSFGLMPLRSQINAHASLSRVPASPIALPPDLASD